MKTGFLSGLAVGFLFFATSYQLLCAFQDVAFLNEHVLRMDDAYYYFQAARNVANLGWVTFDGIHATSGLQVLWGAALAGIAEFVHGRLPFLRAVFILSVFLNAAAALLLRHFGRQLYSRDAGSVAMMLWSGFMLGLSPTIIGVEYPLQVVLVLAILSVWWPIHLDAGAATTGRLHGLGILLTLNYWNRLDAAALSLLVGLAVCVSLVMARPWRSVLWRQVGTLFLWPTAGALAYAALCLAVAHTPMPISGLVKAHYASQHFAHVNWLTSWAGHVAWWMRVDARPMVDIVSTEVLTNHRPIFSPSAVGVLAFVSAATFWSAVQITRSARQADRANRAARFLGLLWVFGALHAGLVVASIGPFSHVTQHYYGWLLVTWCLWAGLMAGRLLAEGPSGKPAHMIVSALLVCVIAANTVIAWRRLEPPLAPGLHNRRVPVIAWINANLPSNARIGAWNAGQLGYFCERPVVNLDGLANDEAYLEFLRSGAPLTEYLRREHITYLVDNNAPDLTMPYRAAWDHDQFFHRTVPWADLEKVYVEPGQADPILVLRVRDQVLTTSRMPRSHFPQ